MGRERKPFPERADEQILTPARVRQILSIGVRVLAEDRVDPIQVALEVRAEFELVLEAAKALATEIPVTNPAAKTGALKLVTQAVERLAQWHQFLGVLPAASLDYEIDARNTGAAVLRVFEKHNISLDVKKEVLAALRPDSENPGPLLSNDLP